jgi:hypothetical protein
MNDQFLGTKGDEAIFTSEDFKAQQEHRRKQIDKQKQPPTERDKQIDADRAYHAAWREREIAKRAYQVDTTSTVAKIAAPYTVQLRLRSLSAYNNTFVGAGQKHCFRVVEITQDSPPMLTILNSQYPEKIKIPADAKGLSLVFYSKPRYEDAAYNIVPYNNRDEFLKNVNLTPTDNYIDEHSVFIVSDDIVADIINNILGIGVGGKGDAEAKAAGQSGSARRKSKKVKKSRKQRKSIKNRKTKHSKK